MEVIFHRRVQTDLETALFFYEREGGNKLAERFFAEADDAVAQVIRNPQGFHFVTATLRRIAFRSFPYHFLYEENDRAIRFLVLRHDKRHPTFGLRRQ